MLCVRFEEEIEVLEHALEHARSEGVIGPNEISFGKSPDGLDILVPYPDRIRLIRDQVFTTGGPVGPAAIGQDAKTLAEAQQLADLLRQTTLSFRAKAGEGERLFGSITAGDIAEALANDKHITIDKRKIELPTPIKELGSRQVSIKLHPEVTANVTVVVEKEEA